jgi:VWFA-related protein
MRRLLGTGALVVVGSLAALSAQPPQRFRSSAELVAVDVLVSDGRRPVAGLRAANFELLDNGVRQSIEQLQLEQLPLNIIMVLDTSVSVEGQRLASLQRAATAVVDRLRKGDRVAVIGFSHRLELWSALTADQPQLREAIAALKADGSTALRDAAFAGIALRGSDQGRALMLLFTDGVDTASFLDERRVLASARRSDVVVYPIGIREEASLRRFGSAWVTQLPTGPPADDRFLKALADETGGRVVYAERDRDLGPAFARVLDEFSSRYVLGYAPTGVSAIGWHRVEVRLKNARGKVTARRGYFAK